MAEPQPARMRFLVAESDDPEYADDVADVSHIDPLPVQVKGVEGLVLTRNDLWVSPRIVVPYGATAGAHDANDALGDAIRIDTSIDGVPLPVKGRIVAIRLIDRAHDTLAATIHVFNAPFAAQVSDAAFTAALLDGLSWVTSETFGTPIDFTNFKAVIAKNVNAEYYAPLGALFAQLSTTGTPTIGATTTPLVQVIIEPRG